MTNHGTKPALAFGPFRLDVAEQVLLRDGRKVRLTPKVFSVLHVLVEHRGRLVDKETLLQTVWADSFVEEGALNRSVSVLRKALGDTALESQYIETVPKRGYRFIATVTEVADGTGETAIEPETRVPRARWTVGIPLAVSIAVAVWYAAVGSSVARDAHPAPVANHRQVTFTGRAGFPTLSNDGERVAYVSDEPGVKKVMVQSLAGGEPLAIVTAPEVGHIRWSPDAAELIVWARGAGMDGVYVISQLGGAPRRIVRNQYVACWSPDGSTIAVGSYLYGTIRFFTRLGDPIRTIALNDVPGSIWSIDWSRAHDRLVVVTSDHQGRYAISTVGANGDEQTQLLVGDAEIPAARWSPDGDAIYFFERRNQTVSLNRMSARKSGSGAPDAMTMMSGLESDQSFALSADATRLVYARAPYYSNLWTLDRTAANGRAPAAALTHGTSLIERPRVSPDGSSIVFNMGRHPTAHVYTMSVRGGVPRQLTFGDSFNVGGTWSPDGTRIAFGSTRSSTPRIWTMNAAGGSASAVSSGDLSDTFDIAWFPGPHILYQQAGNRSYYDLDPLTREEGFLIKTPSPGSWLFSPAYSPNGQQVAVFWNRRPQRGIWIIDTRSRREKFIHAANDQSPMPIGWSVDGTSVYAVIGKPGPRRGPTLSMGETIIDARIIEVFANGGGARPVAELPAQEIGTVTMAPDGLKFYYTVYSSRSDVWVVDNFDASSNVNRRP